jgi:hypothetical protein
MDHKVKTPKSGFDTIIEFYNQELEKNHPIAISEVVDKTGFSWSFIKKTLKNMANQYEGFHFEKSGGTWITWKDREHIIKKTDDTCSRFLADDENNSIC